VELESRPYLEVEFFAPAKTVTTNQPILQTR